MPIIQSRSVAWRQHLAPQFLTHVLAVALLFLLPRFLVAQGSCSSLYPPCDPSNTPPQVSVSNDSYAYSDSIVSIIAYVSDDDGLAAGTFSATLNGTPISLSLTLNSTGTNGTVTGSVRIASGTNVLTLSISDTRGLSASGSGSLMRDPPPPSRPPRAAPAVWASSDPSANDNLDKTRCVAQCFDGVLSYSTPPYTSRDTPRSLTLVYRSSMARPVGAVELDVADPSQTPADYLGLQLRDSAGAPINFLSAAGGTELYWRGMVQNGRVVGLFELADAPTGIYRYTAHATNYWQGASLSSDKPLQLLVVNEKDSPYGVGWSIAGLQRLYRRSYSEVLITEGDGSAKRFTLDSSTAAVDYYHSPAGDFTALQIARTLPTDARRSYPDGTVITLRAADGRMTKVKSRFGDSTLYGYDGSGRLTTVTDPVGKVTTLAYGGNGKLSSITDPGGRVSTIVMDASGQIIEIRDPRGVPAFKGATYVNRLLTGWFDVAGGEWSVDYDGMRQLQRLTTPQVATTSYQKRFATLFRSPLAQAGVFPGAANGPSTAAAASSVRSDSVQALVIAPRGDTTWLRVNRFRQPERVVVREPISKRLKTSTIEYYDSGLPQAITTSTNARTNLTWIGSNLVEASDLTTNLTERRSYDTYGQVVADSLNGIEQFCSFYSGPGRLDSTQVRRDVTRYTWDTARNRVLSVRDPLGHTTSFTYDSTGFRNTHSITAEGNRTTTFSYDAYGRVSTTTNPMSQQVVSGYDLINRPASITLPSGIVTSVMYADSLRRTTVIDAKGQQYQTFVNALGWVTEKIDPRGGHQVTEYDTYGNMADFINRRGQTVRMTYDSLGRILTRVFLNDTTRFAYDTAGRWIGAANASSTDTIKFNAAGQVEQQISVRNGRRYVVTSAYLPSAVRSWTILQGPWGRDTLRLQYDSLQRLKWFSGFGGKGTRLTYNSDGLASTDTLPTGTNASSALTFSTAYNELHEPSSVSANLSAVQDALGRTYTYDQLGRVSTIDWGPYSDAWHRSYGYDPLGRLQSWEDTHTYQKTSRELVCSDETDITTCFHPVYDTTESVRGEDFVYDSVGNRRDHAAVIGIGNRVTSFDGYTLDYDADGNLISKQKTGFTQILTWNVVGQLTSVVTNGRTVTYSYDAFGRRVRKDAQVTAGSSAVDVTRYLYDGDQMIADLDSAGNAIREYTYYPGIDQPHSVRRVSDRAVFYYSTELPGHVTGLVNASNQVVNQYIYGPFGQALTVTEQVAQPFRFAGREYDSEDGLYYYRSRFYDPQLARFVSEDPIGLDGGINPFAYVGNDPTNKRDPSGLCPVGEFQSTVSIRIYIPELGMVDLEVPFCTKPLAPVVVPSSNNETLRNIIVLGTDMSGDPNSFRRISHFTFREYGPDGSHRVDMDFNNKGEPHMHDDRSVPHSERRDPTPEELERFKGWQLRNLLEALTAYLRGVSAPSLPLFMVPACFDPVRGPYARPAGGCPVSGNVI